MQFTLNQEAAQNIDNHICVTAGAGSGKTAVLVERYIKILQNGNVSPQQIVAITFTDKAAAEMKARVIQKLSDNENTEIREQFLEKMNTAPISTIHTFCSNVLREFPFQADVPANFGILQGIDQKLLLRQTVKNTLKIIASNLEDEHYLILKRVLQRHRKGQDILDILTSMVDKRDLVTQLIDEVYGSHCIDRIPEVWLNAYKEVLLSETDINEFVDNLRAVSGIARGRKVEEVERLTSELESISKSNPSSPEVINLLRSIACSITTSTNSIAKRDFIGTRVDTSDVDSEISNLTSYASRIESIPILFTTEEPVDDEYLLSTTHDVLTLYNRIIIQYQTEKLREGKLDFNDLQIKVRDLLRDNSSVRNKIIARHKYYMVDEFQDTNELQYELVMLLTDNLNKTNLFIVGDPKQGIYGFRGADVKIFDKMHKQIIHKGGQDISLSENFRSLSNPIAFTNYFFQRLMEESSESEFEVSYEPLTKARNVNANGAVEIIVGNNDAVGMDEYSLIAKHINKMISDGSAIWKKGDNGVETEQTIEYGDIAILIRYRSHLPDIEQALQLRGIPYLTTGGVGFYQRQEIYDIWNYLNFLNAPKKNETSLIGILRGPAFGISDVELYEISHQNGRCFWEKTKKYNSPTDQLKYAIDKLKYHIKIAERYPINQLIQSIVNETGLIGALRLGRQGQQRWANYQKLLDLARNYDGDEDSHTLSSFIEFLDILITEEPREGDAPVEESQKAVQIMTVHAAKGKQFPVVILPCLDRGGRQTREPYIDDKFGFGFSPLKPHEDYSKSEPEIVQLIKNRIKAKEEAEKKRLFYVGATRTEDRLILSGTLKYDKPNNMLKWLYEILEIDGTDKLSLDSSLDIYTDGTAESNKFELNIPVIHHISESSEHIENDVTNLEPFPKTPTFPERQSGYPDSFTINELVSFVRCRRCYYLEHVFHIPKINNENSDYDKVDLDNAIRHVLDRIVNLRHLDRCEYHIDRAIEICLQESGDSSTSNLREIISTYTDNFLKSELARDALNSSESFTKRQIHAKINGHVISCRFDRVFKDHSGHWQVINYKFSEENLEYLEKEMGFYALLFNKTFPNESDVNINYYIFENNLLKHECFHSTEIRAFSLDLENTIEALQKCVFSSNLQHNDICKNKYF